MESQIAFMPIVMVTALVIGIVVLFAVLGSAGRKGFVTGGLVFGAFLMTAAICFFLPLRARVSTPPRPVLYETISVGSDIGDRIVLAQDSQRHLMTLQELSAPGTHVEGLHELSAIETDPAQPAEAQKPAVSDTALAGAAEAIITDARSPVPLPDWVSTPVSTEGDRELVVVRSEQFADASDAHRDALREATRALSLDFIEHFRPTGSWSLSQQQAQSLAVRRTFTEPIERSAGEHKFTVYRTYLLVELSPSVRNQIQPIWREQVSQGRSIVVIALLGMLTAFAGVVAGFFRLDDRMGGRHRWALLAGAMSTLFLIVAGVGAAGTITSRIDRPASTPVTSPFIETFDRQIEPAASIDHDKQLRLQEVANRMVNAINAADYERVRQDFNDNMLEKFPVEECRAFFDERILGLHGQMKVLEAPTFRSPTMANFVARCERGSLDFTLVLDDDGRVAGMLFKPLPQTYSVQRTDHRTDCSVLAGRS